LRAAAAGNRGQITAISVDSQDGNQAVTIAAAVALSELGAAIPVRR
jgi:hypothetical protein